MIYVLAGQSNASRLRDSGAFVDAVGDAVILGRGGTPLAARDPNPDADLLAEQLGLDWAPESGELFADLLARIPEGEIGGVLWVQGERDALELDTALAYEDNLRAFIAALRAEIGDVPFAIAELSSESYTYAPIVRAAQAQVASDTPGVSLIDTDDLPFLPDQNHYTDEGAAILAQRFIEGVRQAPALGTPGDVGTEGNDLIYAHEGNDTFSGEGGHDVLDGGSGDDWIFGGSGDDTIKGRNGDDRIDGDDGDDWIMGGLDHDAIRGQDGWDTVSYMDLSEGVVVDLARGRSDGPDGDRLTSVEAVQGTVYGDILSGDAGRNALYGEGGDDTLYGGAGGDRLYGGAGNDVFLFSAGQDKVMDWNVGDRIAAAFSAVTITYDDAGAIVALGDDTMLLMGVFALSEADFF